MDRKSIKIKIKSGDFSFAERNKRDVDFVTLQEKLKDKNFAYIQKHVNDQDVQTTLLMSEVGKVYSSQEIIAFVVSDKSHQLKFIYDSFKINNPDTSFEDFQDLISEDEVQKVLDLILEMEGETEAEINNSYKEYLKTNNEISLVDFSEKLPMADQHKLAEIIHRQVKKKKD